MKHTDNIGLDTDDIYFDFDFTDCPNAKKQRDTREAKVQQIITKVNAEIDEEIQDRVKVIAAGYHDIIADSLIGYNEDLEQFINEFANLFAIREYVNRPNSFRETHGIYGGYIDRIVYMVDDQAIDIILDNKNIIIWAITLLSKYRVAYLDAHFWNNEFVGIFDRIEYNQKFKKE